MGATAEKLDTQVNGEQKVNPEGVETCPPPPLAKVPPRLLREERLALENLALKAENLRLQQERLRQDFTTSTRMLNDLQKESIQFQMLLNEKYGVDLSKSTIQSDGSIVPKDAGSNAPALGSVLPPVGR